MIKQTNIMKLIKIFELTSNMLSGHVIVTILYITTTLFQNSVNLQNERIIHESRKGKTYDVTDKFIMFGSNQ